MNKKVLVIGANGFIGSALIRDLKNESDVVGVYHSNKNNLSGEIENIPISSLANLNSDFEEVYVLSAFIPGNQLNEDDRKKLFEANIQLVELVCKKFPGSKIIYSSSVSVYKPKDGTVYENDDEGGINEYGVSKLWGEKIVQDVKRFSIVRFSSVYGPGMKLNTIIPNYINEALKKKVITVWGNGERKQDYIHVTDAVNFLTKSATVTGNDIYLATSSNSISNLRLAEIISKKTGCAFSFIKQDKSPSFCYNNDKTAQKLNYQVSVAIDEGITDLIEWIKEKS